MKSKDFLILLIDRITSEFPEIRCEYGFEIYSRSHFIKVIPSLIRRSKYFKRFEATELLSFINQFPNESLTFITDGDLYEIEDVIYAKDGFRYNSRGQINIDLIIDINVSMIKLKKYHFITEDYLMNTNELNPKELSLENVSFLSIEEEVKIKPLDAEGMEGLIIISSNYAMAA